MIGLHLRGRVRGALAAALFLTALIPQAVGAHAALDTATPADGTTVEGTPAEVAGTYTQDLTADGSSLQLRNAAGDVLATGTVDPADARRMVITALPELEPGDYEVRWVTLSAEDGELERDTWTFTVVAAAGPTSTAPTPTAALTATPEVTAMPTVAPTDATTAPPTPTPSIVGGVADPATADVILPIVAGLAVVLVAAGALLRRRGQSGPPS